MNRAWIILMLAILAEICATLALKQSAGLRRPWWLVVVGVGYTVAFLGLSQATRTLDIGTAYAVWAGVGTGVVALFGVLLFGESMNLLKVSGLTLIIVAVALLHLSCEGKDSSSADSVPAGTTEHRTDSPKTGHP